MREIFPKNTISTNLKALLKHFTFTVIPLHFSVSAKFLLMREINRTMRVSGRNNAEACVTRVMRVQMYQGIDSLPRR